MTSAEIAGAYLDAVVARDYERVESLLADDFRLRDLSPPGFTEVSGPGTALSGLRELLDMFDEVRLVEVNIMARFACHDVLTVRGERGQFILHLDPHRPAAPRPATGSENDERQ